MYIVRLFLVDPDGRFVLSNYCRDENLEKLYTTF